MIDIEREFRFYRLASGTKRGGRFTRGSQERKMTSKRSPCLPWPIEASGKHRIRRVPGQ